MNSDVYLGKSCAFDITVKIDTDNKSRDKYRQTLYVIKMEAKSVMILLLIIASAVIAWELLCFSLGNPPNLC